VGILQSEECRIDGCPIPVRLRSQKLEDPSLLRKVFKGDSVFSLRGGSPELFTRWKPHTCLDVTRSKPVRRTVEQPTLRLERPQKAAKLCADSSLPGGIALDQCQAGIEPATVAKKFRVEQCDLTALRRAGFALMIKGKEYK